ncbi:MAG: hypothetical protein EON90_02005 [Brevundimonas sp.]|nr:MAG: hypothetical protein EON90_02005 [Brevundimonas sp.]
MTPRLTVRNAVVAVCLIGLLLLILFGVSWCSERKRIGHAKTEASIAVATGKALDHVASETPVIRQDQEEKQRAVDELQGADQRLPDGFGADLERVRRRPSEPRHP